MKPIRVRFAPSPTGYLHIGGARTALFNYLFARHGEGKLILRIEDTDRERSTPEAIDAIIDSLTWLGITWDEGPFFQSKRLDVYNKAVKKLMDMGLAFHRTDEGKGTAVVFKTKPEVVSWNDLIHENISFDLSNDPDLVLIKSDGYPTYNFAVVIDDAEMGITHVIRGDDHISNTPKQIQLYKALGLPVPQFAHIPLILGEDGEKLSKRHAHTSVTEYRDLGYLPDAVVNFLSLLGWAPGNDLELMDRQKLIDLFTIERVNNRAAQFNLKKLEWLNGEYVKAVPADKLIPTAKSFYAKAGFNISMHDDAWYAELLHLYHERFRTFGELVTSTKFLFTDELDYNPEAMDKFIKKEGVKEILTELVRILQNLPAFDIKNMEEAMRRLVEEKKLKFIKIAQPIRVSITGTSVSAGIFEVMQLLGKEKTLARLNKMLGMME